MSTLYHPSLYADDKPVESYWEATAPQMTESCAPLTGEESCEIAVIGGGYTGLSAALHLARDHGADVRLLEAGYLGWGASGRNGGFCCLPAAKLSIEQLIKTFGQEETKRFFDCQQEGARLNDDLAASEGFDFDKAGSGNWEVAHRAKMFPGLAEYGEALSQFGIKTKVYSAEEFREVGHDSTEQFGALHMDYGYGLHPLKFARGLADGAVRRGAKLHPNSRVVSWSKEGGRHLLVCANGARLWADKVIMATNGFTREDMHPGFKARTIPAVSNILVTRQMSTEELARHSFLTQSPICNSRNLLFYYRLLPDNRLLFGARGDMTGKPEDSKKMGAWMTRRFYEVFPNWQDVEMEYFWRGLVCFTYRRTPCLGALPEDPSVIYAFGYHANGVNAAPWAGREVAALAVGKGAGEAGIPAPLRGLSPKVPFPFLRPLALRAAYLGYQLQDDVF
ncbi:NAD(P)/FAD-dependent oxidoreductase [Rhodovibrionaceae bacterium A322]